MSQVVRAVAAWRLHLILIKAMRRENFVGTTFDIDTTSLEGWPDGVRVGAHQRDRRRGRRHAIEFGVVPVADPDANRGVVRLLKPTAALEMRTLHHSFTVHTELYPDHPLAMSEQDRLAALTAEMIARIDDPRLMLRVGFYREHRRIASSPCWPRSSPNPARHPSLDDSPVREWLDDSVSYHLAKVLADEEHPARPASAPGTRPRRTARRHRPLAVHPPLRPALDQPAVHADRPAVRGLHRHHRIPAHQPRARVRVQGEDRARRACSSRRSPPVPAHRRRPLRHPHPPPPRRGRQRLRAALRRQRHPPRRRRPLRGPGPRLAGPLPHPRRGTRRRRRPACSNRRWKPGRNIGDLAQTHDTFQLLAIAYQPSNEDAAIHYRNAAGRIRRLLDRDS